MSRLKAAFFDKNKCVPGFLAAAARPSLPEWQRGPCSFVLHAPYRDGKAANIEIGFCVILCWWSRGVQG